MELTKKSKEMLYNGHGVLFVKTGDKEMQMVEFYLGRNGKFHTIDGIELTQRLHDLQGEIEEEE